MKTINRITAVLTRALEDPTHRTEHLRNFQQVIWEAEELSTDPQLECLLRDLAYDLDFYRAEAAEQDDPSYFGDSRLESDVTAVLARIRKVQSEC